jgi:hypothetical protein
MEALRPKKAKAKKGGGKKKAKKSFPPYPFRGASEDEVQEYMQENVAVKLKSKHHCAKCNT